MCHDRLDRVADDDEIARVADIQHADADPIARADQGSLTLVPRGERIFSLQPSRAVDAPSLEHGCGDLEVGRTRGQPGLAAEIRGAFERDLSRGGNGASAPRDRLARIPRVKRGEKQAAGPGVAEA